MPFGDCLTGVIHVHNIGRLAILVNLKILQKSLDFYQQNIYYKDMKQLAIQFDSEQYRQAKELAEKWGVTKQRFLSRIMLRCLERVYNQEIPAKDIISHGTYQSQADAV